MRSSSVAGEKIVSGRSSVARFTSLLTVCARLQMTGKPWLRRCVQLQEVREIGRQGRSVDHHAMLREFETAVYHDQLVPIFAAHMKPGLSGSIGAEQHKPAQRAYQSAVVATDSGIRNETRRLLTA